MKIDTISPLEWKLGRSALIEEAKQANSLALEELLTKAITDFEAGLWSYDGATFINERYKSHKWEVAAFIHDWRNYNGYVGYKVDKEFFSIMTILQYPAKTISIRWLLCRFTFLNIIRHKIKGSFNNCNSVKLVSF